MGNGGLGGEGRVRTGGYDMIRYGSYKDQTFINIKQFVLTEIFCKKVFSD